MIILSLFCAVALLLAIVVAPKNKTQIWLTSLFVPLGLVVFVTLIEVISDTSNISSGYIAGQAMGKCIPPFLLCSVLLVLTFYRKLKEKSVIGFYIAFGVISAIYLALGLYQLHLENEIKQSLSGNTLSNDIEHTSETYFDLSFNCPKNWKVEKEEIVPNLVYMTTCGIEDSDEFINIVISITNVTGLVLDEIIKEAFKGMESTYGLIKVNNGIIYESTFNNIYCKRCNFSYTLFGSDVEGFICIFETNGKTVQYLQQHESGSKHVAEINYIANSIKIK